MEVSKEELIKLYVLENKSIPEISKLFGKSSIEVQAQLKRYKIPFKTYTREALLATYQRCNFDMMAVAKELGLYKDTAWKMFKAHDIPLYKKPLPSKAELEEYIKDNIPYKLFCSRWNIGSGVLFRLLKMHGLHKNAIQMKEDAYLTDEQQQIIFGNLLGDGYMRIVGTNPTLSVGQSRAHGGYVRWLANQLRPFSLKIRYLTEHLKHDGKVATCYKVKFDTHAHKVFHPMYQMFYQPKKVVPTEEQLHKFLTPLAIAVWYMDDGTHGLANISTLGFKEYEVQRLANVLNSKYDLGFSARYNSCYGGYGYSLIGNNSRKFLDFVAPYIEKIPCMRYKLSRQPMKASTPSTTTRSTVSSETEDIV